MSIAINDKLIDWIVKRAENEYRDDVAIVLAYGSFINGTANETSDVDCYFIPKRERGFQFAVDFILDDVGYDIFPMSWERVENISNLKEVLLPCVGDVKILFYSTEEDLDRFRKLQHNLQSNLQNSRYTKKIAAEKFEFACQLYTKMKFCNCLSEVRTCAGLMIMTLADLIAICHQDYYHFGLKKQYEDLKKFKNMPSDFPNDYLDVIQAADVFAVKNASLKALRSIGEFMNWKIQIGSEKEIGNTEPNRKQPDYAKLANTYEEISSSFQKIYFCCREDNAILAFLAAVSLQNTLDEISQEYHMPHYDLLSAYCYSDLRPLSVSAKNVEEDFVQMIAEGGGQIKRFATYEDFERANL